VMVVNNFLAKGAAGSLQMPEAAGTAMGNM
jgi:hypothetical protein